MQLPRPSSLSINTAITHLRFPQNLAVVTQASQGSYDLILALPAFAAWIPDGPKLAPAYSSCPGNERAGKQVVSCLPVLITW